MPTKVKTTHAKVGADNEVGQFTTSLKYGKKELDKYWDNMIN